MWKGKRPSLGHIKIWGCEVFVRREAQDKLEARSEKCLFVGYPKESFGYLFYKLRTIVDTELSTRGGDTVVPIDVSLPFAEQVEKRCKPCRAARWKEAMKSEIQSMYDNQVWNLVDTTTGLKTVGSVTDEESRQNESRSHMLQSIGSIMYGHDVYRPDVSFALSIGDMEKFKAKYSGGLTCESEYIAASEASKEAIWMKNFIGDLGVVPLYKTPLKYSVIMRVQSP
ncbi:putative retrotransposon ty1-copia subclass protein [Tanacetum coccineum]